MNRIDVKRYTRDIDLMTSRMMTSLFASNITRCIIIKCYYET